MNRGTTALGLAALLLQSAAVSAQTYTIRVYSLAGGGGTSTGGGFKLSGTIGQTAAATAPMTGGPFTSSTGFWPAALAAGTGVPAATVTAAVARKSNASGPGGVCDLPLVPGVKSEPRQGGVSEVRISFDVPPGGPGTSPVTIEHATCAAPAFVPYSGASTSSASVAGNDLVLTFTPGLENARTYKVNIGPDVTTVSGQYVEVRGLVADASGDGLVNSADRSAIVGIWTGSGFSCATDINSSGQTNAADRSAVVGAWTSPAANCAP